MVWPASLPSLSPGDILTAAHIDDIVAALDVVGGAWIPYTPTLTGSTTDPTLGASSITGRYRKANHTLDVHIRFVVGAGYSAGSGAYRFSLPAGVTLVHSSGSEAMGTATVRDVSAPTTYPCVAVLSTAASVALQRTDTIASVTSAAPMVWATGDSVSIHMLGIEIV